MSHPVPSGLLLVLLLAVPTEALRAQDSSSGLFRLTNAILADWEVAWRSGEAEETASFYTEDAVLVLPDGEWIAGRDEIRTALRERILPASEDVRLRPRDIVRSGRMIVGTGRFWIRMAYDGLFLDRTGTYMVVFLEEDRRWRIRSQFFSAESLP